MERLPAVLSAVLGPGHRLGDVLSAVREWGVVITEDDVRFVELAQRHYKLFAETVERQGGDRDTTRTAGVLRAQEFYAERFLLRIREADHGG